MMVTAPSKRVPTLVGTVRRVKKRFRFPKGKLFLYLTAPHEQT
jgi:hypothetical protein